jgi:hypothetical protein
MYKIFYKDTAKGETAVTIVPDKLMEGIKTLLNTSNVRVIQIGEEFILIKDITSIKKVPKKDEEVEKAILLRKQNKDTKLLN